MRKAGGTVEMRKNEVAKRKADGGDEGRRWG